MSTTSATGTRKAAAAGPAEGAAARPGDRPGPSLLRPGQVHALLATAAVGGLVVLVGWFVDRAAAVGGLLVAGQLVLGIAVGALLLLALAHVAKGGWVAAIRRVPEALVGALPLAAALVLGTVLLALPVYFFTDADAVAHDALLAMKATWIDTGPVILRTVLFLAVWCLFGWGMRRLSRRQETAADAGPTRRAIHLSCLFLVVFGVTWTLLSVDWLMALEPHWYSTVFAIYGVASMLVSALAAITVFAILLERAGPLRGVLRDDHLHDLGKLTFGMVTFWAYIWYCQYMLIWYAAIPEEVTWYVHRTEHGWGVLLVASLVVTWLVPFLALLPRRAKRSRTTMLRIAVLLLVGRWLDLHVLVMPALAPEAPWAVGWALAAILAFGALFVWRIARAFEHAPPVPHGDPYLDESLAYHA